MAITRSNETSDTAADKINELKQLVADVINDAKKAGADATEIGVVNTKGLSVETRLGELETVEHHQDKSISLVVYLGKRKGGVSINDFSKRSIKESIDAAINIAKYAEEDTCAGIAEVELLAKEVKDLDLYHPAVFNTNDAIEIALEAENAALSFDGIITNSNGASFSGGEKYRVYGNSNGFIGGYPSTSYFLSVAPIAQDNSGNMERDYDYTVSRVKNNLKDPKAIGESAAKKAISRLGAEKLPTANMPILFSAKCATGLVGHFLSAVSGGSIYRRSSFLLDSLNKSIFPEFINVFERPHVLQGLGSTPFDTDGLATVDQSLVRDGLLQQYILSVYSARRLKLKPTANSGGVHNLYFKASDEYTSPKDELISSMDKGLIVTELMGQGINLVTGDYSRGATGFYVENGKIKHPVSEVTIAGNLATMFQQILRVGSDVETRGNVLTGSILIEDMKLAGI